MSHPLPDHQQSSNASSPAAAIHFARVSRSYMESGHERRAVQDVELAVAPGEFLAIMGHSGSGKTTLLNMACGIDRPTSGRVLLDGQPVNELADRELTLLRRRRFGIVFQFFNLLPTLTSLENVVLPAYLEGIGLSAAHARAIGLIEEVGLAGREQSYPDRMSGGEQQRLAIARALINNPDIILADEPTGNLDSETGEFVLNKLRTLSHEQGKTIIMVTHSTEAANYASRCVRIRDGRLVSDSPSQ